MSCSFRSSWSSSHMQAAQDLHQVSSGGGWCRVAWPHRGHDTSSGASGRVCLPRHSRTFTRLSGGGRHAAPVLVGRALSHCGPLKDSGSEDRYGAARATGPLGRPVERRRGRRADRTDWHRLQPANDSDETQGRRVPGVLGLPRSHLLARWPAGADRGRVARRRRCSGRVGESPSRGHR